MQNRSPGSGRTGNTSNSKPANEAQREDLRGYRYLSTDFNEYAFAGSGLEGERYDNPQAFPPAPVKTFSGKGPKGYQRSDERIREDVCERLMEHHDIDASEIDVSVQAGIVSFSGKVSSKRMKYEAEDVAEKVSGVKEVQNQLRVIAFPSV